MSRGGLMHWARVDAARRQREAELRGDEPEGCPEFCDHDVSMLVDCPACRAIHLSRPYEPDSRGGEDRPGGGEGVP